MLDVSLVMRKLIKFLSFVFFFFFTFALKATLECIHNTQYVAWNFILVFSILCSVTILIPFSMPNEWICFQFRNSTKTTKKIDCNTIYKLSHIQKLSSLIFMITSYVQNSSWPPVMILCAKFISYRNERERKRKGEREWANSNLNSSPLIEQRSFEVIIWQIME